MKKYLLLAFFVIFSNTTVFGISPIHVKISDTISGYSSSIRIKTQKENTKIEIKIIKPDKAEFFINDQTDEFGILKTAILGYHTKKIGKYKVIVSDKNENHVYPEYDFEVFPDKASEIFSKIIIDDNSVEQGGEVKLKVRLNDKNENPIKNHFVEIISSRSDDKIEAAQNGKTNEFGEATFKILSSVDGISYISAIDKNDNIVVKERGKIIFFKSEEKSQKIKSIGGDLKASFLSEDLYNDTDDGNDFGPIDHFEIEFPDKVSVNSESNFLTIKAMDKENRVSKNYNGTIIIYTPDDPRAELPVDGTYRFTDRDQGVRKFDLALKFSKTGKQKIFVSDFEDGRISSTIMGEKSVEVVDKCLEGQCQDSERPIDFSAIEILTPKQDSEFSSSNVSISGKAKENIDLILFIDGDENKFISTDESGLFSDSIKNLSEGKHEIYLKEKTGFEEESEKISFLVDTQPPEINKFSIYPEGKLETESSFVVTVLSEPNLIASVEFSGKKENLVESDNQPGKYMANLKTSDIAGDYLIEIKIEDQIGNENKESKKIQVVKLEEDIPPPVGLEVESLNQSIKLQWEPLKKFEDRIKKYRVRLGENNLFLETIIDVSGDESKIVIENLENDKEYFLVVSAVDYDNEEGEKSRMVSIIPKEDDKINEDVINNTQNDQTNDPGSVVDNNNVENLKIVLNAIAKNGAVDLSWNDIGSSSLVYYDIRFGTNGNNLSERLMISSVEKQVTIEDLINGIEYFFEIVPLDINALPLEDKSSEIVSARPNFLGIHNAPVFEPIKQLYNLKQTDESGSGSLLIFIATLIFSVSMFVLQKIRLFSVVTR